MVGPRDARREQVGPTLPFIVGGPRERERLLVVAHHPLSPPMPSPKLESSLKFEAAKTEAFLSVLAAVSWLNCPDVKQVSQFTELDPKLARQLLRNGTILGMLASFDGELYSLLPPYPFDGPMARQRDVVREALVRMPLLANVRQFMSLGDSDVAALRKAATVQRIQHFDPDQLAPLLKLARELRALGPGLVLEDLYEEATRAKRERHKKHPGKRVVLLSHHSRDNPLVRQLATDLSSAGVSVWLHEQRVPALNSPPENLSLGLAESDFALLAMSRDAAESAWAQTELTPGLLAQFATRENRLLTLTLGKCTPPELVRKRPAVDLSGNYKAGLRRLLEILRAELGPVGDFDPQPTRADEAPPPRQKARAQPPP